jgi:MYXO-CTERM domain-containing protein
MRRFCLMLCSGLLASLPVATLAQQGAILNQQLDARGEGFTVLQVWGDAYAMGYAQGAMLADPILVGVNEVQELVGESLYPLLRTFLGSVIWRPAEVEQELEGMVAGIKASRPDAALDVLDLKAINTLGDWSYAQACRSHSTWGSFVQAPSKTLSTRRLDFGTPVSTALHHVLLARVPDGGGVRWVNLAQPGLVTAATAVNEHGTLASLHDYQSQMVPGAFLPRTVAIRHALTLVAGLPPAQHLDAVYQELSSTPLLTGTFINYYMPEGLGGVITCSGGAPCHKLRVPQADYFGGEVLITTNSETDGHTTPAGGDFMASYYQAGKPKTLADHYALMGHDGLHLMSVDYRGRGEMTIWAEGRISGGVTPTVKVEFSDLVALAAGTDGGAQPPVDGGSNPVGDGAVPDADWPGSSDGAAPAGDATAEKQENNDEGCSCAYSADSPLASGWLLSLLALAVFLVRRPRRR